MRHPSLLRVLLCTLLLGGCGGDEAPVDGGPPPIDQCTNASDLAAIANLVTLADASLPDGGVPDGGPYPTTFNIELGIFIADTCTGFGQPCFQNILTETDVEACLTDCLAGTPGAGLSSGCVDCWVETVPCGSENCITQCATDINSPGCNQCFLDNCAPRVEACTGLPFTETP